MIFYELTIEHSKYGHNFIIRECNIKSRGNGISRIVMNFNADCYDDLPEKYILYVEGGYAFVGELMKIAFYKIKELWVYEIS